MSMSYGSSLGPWMISPPNTPSMYCALKCEWYMVVPAASARKRYVKEVPGVIGHCEMEGTPSYCGASRCGCPCQWIDVPRELSHYKLRISTHGWPTFSRSSDAVLDGDLNPISEVGFYRRSRKLFIDKYQCTIETIWCSIMSRDLEIVLVHFSSIW